MRLLPALVLAVLALPAAAQASSDEAAPVAEVSIDDALVGDWTLIRVNNAGAMERFGAEVEDMWASFEASGSGEVRVEVTQDQERHERTRTFRFSTRGGQIVSPDGPPVSYEVLGGDLLVLRDNAGLVVELRKVGA
jgi:hypothetical protein